MIKCSPGAPAGRSPTSCAVLSVHRVRLRMKRVSRAVKHGSKAWFHHELELRGESLWFQFMAEPCGNNYQEFCGGDSSVAGKVSEF